MGGRGSNEARNPHSHPSGCADPTLPRPHFMEPKPNHTPPPHGCPARGPLLPQNPLTPVLTWPPICLLSLPLALRPPSPCLFTPNYGPSRPSEQLGLIICKQPLLASKIMQFLSCSCVLFPPSRTGSSHRPLRSPSLALWHLPSVTASHSLGLGT